MTVSLGKSARALLVLSFAAGGLLSLLFGTASFLAKQGTHAASILASRLVPFNSAYLIQLAGWEPGRRNELLQQAVALNPFEEQAWIKLGLSAELSRHDPAAAEKLYLKAAAVDHMFLPKWTLTNFYYRQGNRKEFSRWARASLEITPFSGEAIFTEMWALEPNANYWQDTIPDQPGILAQYALFLMNAGQVAASPPIISRLVRVAGQNPWDLNDILGPVEDRLLWDGLLPQALEVWTTLSRASWIKLRPPSPAKPVTNGNFAEPFWGHGFDWYAPPTPGETTEQSPDTSEAQFRFSGDEPEHCTLLQQWITLAPGKTYIVSWSIPAVGSDKIPGLSWHLSMPQATEASQREMDGLDLTGTSPAAWSITVPPNVERAVLSLRYARPLGETRAKGTVVLRSVKMG